MDYIHEIIKFNETLPIKLFVHSVNHVQNHWHESIELLFILSGKVGISIGGASYEACEEDIVLINLNEIHALSSKENNMILALQIPVEFIKNHYEQFKDTYFDCKSFIYKGAEQHRFNIVRNILAEMMWIYTKNEEACELQLQSFVFELIYVLFKNFKAEESDTNSLKNSEKYLDRLSRIINYIGENYNVDISLNTLAQMEYLSVPYLSKFFQKYMGMTFSSYLNHIRLEHAIKDMLYKDLSITQIALDNGFTSEKSFFNVFKELYGETPNQYRKKLKNNSVPFGKENKNTVNYLEVDSQSIYTALFKYLDKENDMKHYKEQTIQKYSIEADVSIAGTTINHTWKMLTTVGKAKDGLFADVQKQLSQVQKEIGFKYLRFHGIFDDEMMVYTEDEQGQVVLNFGYIDKLFDFLYSISLKPFVELGFMPGKLAKTKKSIFYRNSIISMPKEMQKWNLLIREFIEHCTDRYGKEEVESWYFEVWNEPDLTSFFGFEKEEEYFELYESTYHTIKEICTGARVGGPAAALLETSGLELLEHFLVFCKDNCCVPDFISYHSYPMVFERRPMEEFPRVSLSEDERYLEHLIEKVKVLTEKLEMGKMEMYITEWNATPWHRDLVNDTCYKAAYIVKNAVENMNSISSLGYWVLTDFIEELQVPEHTFHGGIGVITNNGMKKAGYYAFWLLNKLGNQLISAGEGYYITASKKGFQIIFYNYCHYDRLYRFGDISKMSMKDRYNVFINDHEKEVELRLKGLEASKYEVKRYSVNRKHGSTFDTWVEIGAAKYLTVEEVTYINGTSVPLYTKEEVYLNGEYVINARLQPHEIRLYEVSRR